MHQPPQQPVIPQTQPHIPHTLQHSKPQSNIHSPIRNFLHDERLLNQNIFNQFTNLPPTFNTNSSIPPPISANNQHLPRSNSTSVLPIHKTDALGNVVPVNGPGVSPSISGNPSSRNSQDPKKTNRITPTGLSNLTGPSSLPTNIAYSRNGSGSGSSSSSPPHGGSSPFSTPPVSPNPVTGPPRNYPPASAIPPFPLSTSPPNTIHPHKSVSFVDNPYPKSKHVLHKRPSEPSMPPSYLPFSLFSSFTSFNLTHICLAVIHIPKTPLSFSQKQFVVPKVFILSLFTR